MNKHSIKELKTSQRPEALQTCFQQQGKQTRNHMLTAKLAKKETQKTLTREGAG
jgi:hypothetical protein